jgi:hypothetical protein
MTFDWEGRTAQGQKISGTQEGTSTMDVRARLEAQGITVTRVDQTAAQSFGTVDFAARIEGRAPRRQLKWPAIVVLVFGGLGGALAYFAPVVSTRCDRAADGVRCTVAARALGVVPIWTTSLADVVSLETLQHQTTVSRRSGSSSGPRTRTLFYDSLVFINRRHERMPVPEATGTFGDTTGVLETRFRQFLDDPSQVEAAGWQGQGVPALVSIVFLLIAAILLAVLVLGLVAGRQLDAAGEAMTSRLANARRRS